MVSIVSNSGRKLGGGAIDPERLVDMRLNQRMTWEEIGMEFGVTGQACSQMFKRIKSDAIPGIYEAARKLSEAHISIRALTAGLLGDCAEILKDVKKNIAEEDGEWDKLSIQKRQLQLATMGEIRAQMKMYREISAEMYSEQANEEFQAVMIETINELEPAVAQKILQRLSRLQPDRQLITASGS